MHTVTESEDVYVNEALLEFVLFSQFVHFYMYKCPAVVINADWRHMDMINNFNSGSERKICLFCTRVKLNIGFT